MDQAPSTDQREVRSVNPLLYACGRFGGIRNRHSSRSSPAYFLISSPLLHSQRYSPLSPHAIPLCPPIIGPKTSIAQTRNTTPMTLSCLLLSSFWEISKSPLPAFALDKLDAQNSVSVIWGEPGDELPYICDPGIKQEIYLRGGIWWEGVGLQTIGYLTGRLLFLRISGDESLCF